MFGEQAPAVGKLVRIDDTVDLRVTGVYEDLPFNSSFSELGFVAPWDLAVMLNAEIGGDAAKTYGPITRSRSSYS